MGRKVICMVLRPLAVTIIGWLFLIVGAATFVGGFVPLVRSMRGAGLETPAHEWRDFAMATTLHVLAIVAGAGLLWRRDWARWLTLAWMGCHVVLSFWHAASQGIVHGVMLVALAYFLFRPTVTAWFRGAGQLTSGER